MRLSLLLPSICSLLPRHVTHVPRTPSTSPSPAVCCCRFWEATSGICYRTLQYADSQVNKLEITADKTLIAAAGNPHIRCVRCL